ncbi:MAG: bifunctional 2-methylcitrate dehydratase/aconitate hydratase [Methylococcaceae bacterium]|nr:bifunctional 2-methylcitrate dehydratase/aconitate hydratase [Methylococcaceae bacterium]MCI0734651.1 bifunctional 2-methylcitrate dehydratase/aconitate hydratase [Methylococcaceae bacterium]
MTGKKAPDKLFGDIADYVLSPPCAIAEVRNIAGYCLMDSLGCALLALEDPDCTRLLGPLVPGADLETGTRVPGTSYRLDPVQAAFNIGAMVRWLDFNDTWLAAEWGHPSDNLAAILAVSDYLCRNASEPELASVTIADILSAMIKAYEIQGVIALENSFNRAGLDHVLLVRAASAAVVTGLLGGGRSEIISALSNAWVDGGALRIYRHGTNTGSRKCWAAGDAASRAVRLALLAMRGEPGYERALSDPDWGFCRVLFRGKPFQIDRPFGTYVMENILFKVSYPAEFHGQTAVEAAIRLHPEVSGRLDAVRRVVIETQESGFRIIHKEGPLRNPSDRDHCLQYMVAVALIYGDLKSGHYGDRIASDPRIESLRNKMEVIENPDFSRDYLDPRKRSIANSVQVFFSDGTCTGKVLIEYPLGHRRRRGEAIPLLKQKFAANLASRVPERRCGEILRLFENRMHLEKTPVREFLDLFVV